jgi:hypothetical protein
MKVYMVRLVVQVSKVYVETVVVMMYIHLVGLHSNAACTVCCTHYRRCARDGYYQFQERNRQSYGRKALACWSAIASGIRFVVFGSYRIWHELQDIVDSQYSRRLGMGVSFDVYHELIGVDRA